MVTMQMADEDMFNTIAPNAVFDQLHLSALSTIHQIKLFVNIDELCSRMATIDGRCGATSSYQYIKPHPSSAAPRRSRSSSFENIISSASAVFGATVKTPSSLQTEIKFLIRWFAHANINTPPAVLHIRCAKSPVRNPDESASLTCDKSSTILLCPPEFRNTNSAFILGAESPSNIST